MSERTARGAGNRQAIVEAMRQLALTKGFPATTVEEVCDSAGVTKGSFYYYFSSKDELGLAALQLYFDDVSAAFGAGAWSAEEDPVRRLQAFIAHAGDVCTGPVMVNGCLIGSFALDLAESSPEVRQILSTMFDQLRDVVAGLIEQAAAQRGVTVDSSRLGDQFLVVVEGSIVLAKAHADRSRPRQGMELFSSHINLLLGEPS